VVRRHVEKLEVRPVIFHVTAAVDLESEISKNGIDAAKGLCRGVQAAVACRSAGQGYVDRVTRQALGYCPLFLRVHRVVVALEERLLDPIHFLAICRAIRGRDFAYFLKRLRYVTLLAEIAMVPATQSVVVMTLREVGESLSFESGKVCHDTSRQRVDWSTQEKTRFRHGKVREIALSQFLFYFCLASWRASSAS
jgi:hypothetical protein